ncbi:MAG: hypothetical protein HY918_01890 [Candidatus Doudnabacteria bacterium]|nr:hypothetical protein [Candidatus Doudnabacteria bacterium]
MNKQEIEKSLGVMSQWQPLVPTGHKHQLKLALLQYGLKNRPGVWAWLKKAGKHMQQNFKIASFVAGTMVGVLMFSGVQYANNSPELAKYNPFATPTAQAKAEVRNVMHRVSLLSEDQRVELEKKFKLDMTQSLKEAYEAKDLVISDASQFQPVEGMPNTIALTQSSNAGFVTTSSGNASTAPLSVSGAMGFAVSNVGTGEGAENSSVSLNAGTVTAVGGMKKLSKRLTYTDPQGNKTVLMLDEDGLPVMKMTMLSDEESLKLKQQADRGEVLTLPATGATFHTEVEEK